MKGKFGVIGVVASALLWFGLPAFSQQDVSVQFTGSYTTTWGNSGGTYGAGIYGANINGSPSVSGIVCDDFNDEITSGESWNAKAYQASGLVSGSNPTLGNTLFGNTIGVTGYAEVATLVSMMFSNTSKYGSISNITQAELSSAIWDITKPGGLSGLDATATNLVQALKAAFSSNTTAEGYLATLTNLWILTPDPLGYAPNGQQTEPQEMWVSLPEGGAAIMYLVLAALCCSGGMWLGHKKQWEC